MSILMVVSYAFAGLVLLIFLRVFWRPIVFVAVLVWELFWKGLVPLLALPFHAGRAVRHRHMAAASPMNGKAANVAASSTSAECEWMAQAGARVDATLAREATAVSVTDGVPPERNEWR